MEKYLEPAAALPKDAAQATLVGRAFVPGGGPCVIALRDGVAHDITRHAPTISDLLDRRDAVDLARSAPADAIGEIGDLLANSHADTQRAGAPVLLAPVDLCALKAAGVTFIVSLLERVIEEQAKGDPSKAEAIRRSINDLVGTSLADIVPGSPAAEKLKTHLQASGGWSQYLEVGIGPDAEVFTKAQPMSAVGTGADIGLHPKSAWNNPEPEVVLAVNSRGETVGATLGNDVNLRDFEGRSALLLSKAKDNNASTAIGPFIRLFDADFTADDMRKIDLRLTITGEDGFVLEGSSAMSEIARDPLDIVAQTINDDHQYPDGFVLFLGTMFAPIQDRDRPGEGFTHKPGDVVAISADRLGTLVNRVTTSDKAPPWTFGTRALMRNLAARGLLG